MSKHEIRRMRIARNLLGQQLAARMGVSAPRISVLERDEQKGAVTLKMMARAAEALECDFVYALVPKAGAAGLKPRLKLGQSETASTLDTRLQALLDKPAAS
jgi:predicted DNA-binding mobile mystery protein A